MLIAKNDEEKRSRIWRYVTGTTTVLILVVIVYFLYEGFFGNPLVGTWTHDDSDMTLEVQKDNNAVLTWHQLIEGKDVKINLGYTLDRQAKQITFKVKQEELDKTAKALGGDVNADDVEASIHSFLSCFNYSVDGMELTLTEWDYGDQMYFTKKGR